MVPKISNDVLESQSVEVSKKPNYIIKRKKEEAPIEAIRPIVFRSKVYHLMRLWMVPKTLIDVLESQLIEVSNKPNNVIKQNYIDQFD